MPSTPIYRDDRPAGDANNLTSSEVDQNFRGFVGDIATLTTAVGNIKGPVGPYADTTALQAAYPAASNSGRVASVGTSAPYTSYYSNGVTWGLTVPLATTAAAGASRLADGAAVTAGTPERVVDASQLKAAVDTLVAQLVATGNRLALVGNSITAFAKPAISGETYDLGSWTPNSSVLANQTILSPTIDLRNGVQFIKHQAAGAGVTGSQEPAWPQTVGQSVVDGSVTWNCIASTNTAASWPLSWWTIAQALAGQPLDEVYIVGQGGRLSDTILPTVDRALAAGCDVVFFANIFENNTWPGSSPSLSTIATQFTAYVAKVDQCRKAGKRVIVQTLLPSGNIDTGGTAFTGYSRGNGTKAWAWLNAKIREMARARPDVILFEPDLLYIDPIPTNGSGVWPENTVTYASATGTGQLTKKTDAIHPQMAAHWIIGKALAAVLRANFPPSSRFGAASDEVAKAVNPLKGGTSGTAGTNVTGSVATGYTVNAFVASGVGTGTASLVPRTDISGFWQRLVYSAATSADGAQIAANANITLAPYAVGDVVQMFNEVRVASTPTLLTSFTKILRFNGAGAAFDATAGTANLGANDQDLGQFIATTETLILKTPPVKIPTGTTTMGMFLKTSGRVAASFTVDFGRESIQRTSVGVIA